MGSCLFEKSLPIKGLAEVEHNFYQEQMVNSHPTEE